MAKGHTLSLILSEEKTSQEFPKQKKYKTETRNLLFLFSSFFVEGLMPWRLAKKTPVIKIPLLLNSEEIQSIFNLAGEVSKEKIEDTR